MNEELFECQSSAHIAATLTLGLYMGNTWSKNTLSTIKERRNLTLIYRYSAESTLVSCLVLGTGWWPSCFGWSMKIRRWHLIKSLKNHRTGTSRLEASWYRVHMARLLSLPVRRFECKQLHCEPATGTAQTTGPRRYTKSCNKQQRMSHKHASLSLTLWEADRL